MIRKFFDISSFIKRPSTDSALKELSKQISNSGRIFICAGEPSGDFHSSNLVREILKKRPEVEIHGIAGQHTAEAGANIILDCESLSVMGITDVISNMATIRAAFSKATNYLKDFKPDLVILVDYPGFNLKLAEKAHELGIKVFYYISPKIWAWGSGRIEKIRKYVDHMGLILPFEEDFYRKNGVKATYVGNPLIDSIPEPVIRSNDAIKKDWVIGLLPGSRGGEISRHLPVMLESASIVLRSLPNVRFILSIKDEKYAESEIKRFGLEVSIAIETGDVRQIFGKTDLIVAASGTVTLEAAIACVPTIIIYKMSEISFRIAKKLVRVDYAGLANLIAGREVSPELLQSDASPQMISEKVKDLINNPEKMDRMRSGFILVRKKLGKPGASSRAANIVLSMLDDAKKEFKVSKV